MPVVAKCPNCNGPLDKAPTGPESKCPFCGATLLATRYMPSPAAPGPVSAPGYPPPVAPPPASSGGWGTPVVGAPGPYPVPPPPVLPTITVTARRASSVTYIISSVVTLLVIGGTIFGVFMMQRQVQEQVEQTTQAAQQAIEDSTKPLTLPELPLEPGKDLVLTLPGAGGRRVSAWLPLTLEEETPFEITALGSEAYVSCRLKAFDAQEKALARSEEGDKLQIYPVLPAGRSKVFLDCSGHPSERSVRVLARPLPLVTVDEPTRIVLEPGFESAGAGLIPGQAGLYAVAADCEDGPLNQLQVLGAQDVLLGRESVGSTTKRAILELELEDQGYLAQIVRSSSADQKIPATIVLTRIDPEPIAVGGEVKGTMTRHVLRRYYELKVEAATKLAVTLAAPFEHIVELRRADGVAVATSDAARANREARLAPAAAIEPGTYRLVVRGEEYAVSEGEFTLRVEAVPDAPAPRRGGRRGGG
ncbi:MAG: hypothetical protein GYA57_00270 [Myxococcales bacterium]|nr:hypothetical protein [Myxococcales bacterium]